MAGGGQAPRPRGGGVCRRNGENSRAGEKDEKKTCQTCRLGVQAFLSRRFAVRAEVAQLVEQGTENPRVGSSILSLGTMRKVRPMPKHGPFLLFRALFETRALPLGTAKRQAAGFANERRRRGHARRSRPATRPRRHHRLVYRPPSAFGSSSRYSCASGYPCAAALRSHWTPSFLSCGMPSPV